MSNQKNKPTFYIHIGMSKTGSSALQLFCESNEVLLATIGLLYPKTGRFVGGAHWGLFPGSFSVWEDLIREVSLFPSLDVLVSLESIFCDPTRLEIFSKIPFFFKNYSVKFILYIRRLDTHSFSFYKQICKSGVHLNNYGNYLDYLKKPYDALTPANLKIICDIVGKDNLIYGYYDKDRMINANLIDDFFNKISIDIPLNAIRPGQVNPSLPTEAVNFFSRAVCPTSVSPKLREELCLLAMSIYNDNEIEDIYQEDLDNIKKQIVALTEYFPDYQDLYTRKALDLNISAFGPKNKEVLFLAALLYRILGALEGER